MNEGVYERNPAITQLFSAEQGECQHIEVMIPLALVKNIFDNGEHGYFADINHHLPWPAVREILQYSTTQNFLLKWWAPLLSPTIYVGTRGQNSASESALLVLDADGKTSDSVKIGQVVKLFQELDLECVVYSSPSNQDGGRFRVVVPLKEPVDIPTQMKGCRALTAFIGDMLKGEGDWQVDEGKSNPYSLFVMPGNFTYSTRGNEYGKLVSEFHHVNGEIFDAAGWITAYPQADPEPVTAPYNQNRTLNPYSVADSDGISLPLLSHLQRGLYADR
jgi:hypothetical protein